MKTYYHFTGKTLRDGRPIPPIGEWLVHDGPVLMCGSGLHASKTAAQALKYAPGELLHRVNLSGDLKHDTDKSIGRKRKIIASIDATELLREFSRRVALDVVHLWDAPPVVVEYLKTGNESLRNAEGAAARAAAGNARNAAGNAARAAAGNARAAARDAAWNAARNAGNAAGDAAWNAAGDAAWAAAQDAAWNAAQAKYDTWFNEMVDAEFAKAETK